MTQAKQGDTVRVHYTGKLSDGTVFDTSLDTDPIEFTIGEDEVIPGFEQAVVGMSIGESKTVEVPADQAYGQRDEGLILAMDRSRIPEGMELEVDDQLQVRRGNGQVLDVTVVAVSESGVTLDGNSPLAGQDLTFDLKLVEIV